MHDPRLLAHPPCGPVLGHNPSPAGGREPCPRVTAWLGIPYALPPTGLRRWKPPVPASDWTSPLDACRFGADAPQAPHPDLRGAGMDEDCLFLNVWAPEGAAEGSLPVMVWVHGGGFAGGSGSDLRSDGAALARQGVVVVSFNYRVGVLGFLAHPQLNAESPDGVSGNYGLLDQIEALRWVQRNIAAFGGDAARVTVFGVSAGSASISLLLTSPHARGLFQRAILHSPGTGRPLADLEQACEAGLQLGSDLATLRQWSAQQVFEHTGVLSPKVRSLTRPRVLRPIRDGWLLPEDEPQAFRAGRLAAMPLLLGSNADEGSALVKPWPLEQLAQHRELLQTNFGASAVQATAVWPAASDADVRHAIGEAFADTQFNYGVRLLARTMRRTGQPVWRYVFTRRRPGQSNGPHHADEVPYVFGTLGQALGHEGFDRDDEWLSQQMMQAWVQFAREGQPGPVGAQAWPGFEEAQDTHLVLDVPVGTGAHWRRAPLDFLDDFFTRSATD